MLSFPADGKKHNLLISSSGYGSVSQPITGSSDAIVHPDEKTGQGIGRRGRHRLSDRQEGRDLLASVSSVSSKDLKDIPLNSAEEALAGRLAGVQVTGAEGVSQRPGLYPGAGGIGSITQNNAPLYVVDGVQVDNALATISPQDIESIDVLKDAAATSIYGARGSNGVVIITTKGGRDTGGKTRITYSGQFGVSILEKKNYRYSHLSIICITNSKGPSKPAATPAASLPYGDNWDSVLKYKNVPGYDPWQKKDAGTSCLPAVVHNISVSGGTALGPNYNLSITDNTLDGVMLLSDYQRRLLAFRFDHQRASENLHIGANIRFNNTTVDGAGTSNPRLLLPQLPPADHPVPALPGRRPVRQHV